MKIWMESSEAKKHELYFCERCKTGKAFENVLIVDGRAYFPCCEGYSEKVKELAGNVRELEMNAGLEEWYKSMHECREALMKLEEDGYL